MHIALLAALAAIATSAFAADLPPETPLVTRGNLSVTVADFNAVMSKVPVEQQDEYRASLKRVRSTVSNLYVQRALARDAEAAGIDKEPAFEKRLQLLREGLLATIYMERFEKTIVPPNFEARARELYAASPERYKVAEKVKLRHILVAFHGRTKEEALRRVNEAREKLLANQPFAAVAKEYSNDPTYRGNDGVIGPVGYSGLMSEVADAARKLPLNQVSEPIESSAGYHLVTVLQRVPPKVVPYEEAKEGLIKDEQIRYRKKVIDKRLAEVTVSKDIVMYTDNIAALRTEIDREMVHKKHEERAAQEAAEAQQDAAQDAAARKAPTAPH